MTPHPSAPFSAAPTKAPELARRPGFLVAFVAYVLLSVGLLGGIAHLVMERRLAAHEERHAVVLRQLEAREAARLELAAALAGTQTALEAKEAALRASAEANERLTRDLRQGEIERAAIAAERDLAQGRARALALKAGEAETWLETVGLERRALERGRDALQNLLDEAAQGQAAATLRWREAEERALRAETMLARQEAEQTAARHRLAGWIDRRLEGIDTVMERTGMAPERLVARADGAAMGGQGGPYLPARGQAGLADPVRLAAIEPGSGGGLMADLDRLEMAERLLRAMPLAAPFDQFHVTSGFGARTDPFTGREAVHQGLDLGAAAGSEVLAPAPGRVIHAGRMGGYGLMVELDHGHGLTSRYAHLSELLVAKGNEITVRAALGIIGSTGRSTGRHLHYEIRLNGEPLDPLAFITAGRELIGALGG